MFLTAQTKGTVVRGSRRADAATDWATRLCLSSRRLRFEPLEDRRLLSVLEPWSAEPIAETTNPFDTIDIGDAVAVTPDPAMTLHPAEFAPAATTMELSSSGGLFSDSSQNLGNAQSMDAALGDLDGDGDLDAYVGNNGANMVWLNDGLGHFSDSGQRMGGANSWRVALGDVDSDGDLDAVAANAGYIFGEPNLVWLNDGAGNFSDSGQELGYSGSCGVALGDLDGDRDLDAYVGNYYNSMQDEVYLNDGGGTFTDSGQRLSVSETHDVALGDLDGDGDLDAFAFTYGGANRTWHNDGQSNFTDSGQRLGLSNSKGLGLGDLDGDGDLDAFVTNSSDQPNSAYLNDGFGSFTDSGQSLGNSDSRGGALGDLDGDGDLDAFVANWDQPNKVWMNQTTGAGITVSPTSGLITSEFGGTAEFTVVLNSAPTADVSIGISSSDTTEGTVSLPSLMFTPSDWNVPQTVTVTGVDDSLEDGEVVYAILIAPATSADSRYDGITPPDDVLLTNVDDEQLITVTPTSGLATTEAGGTA